MQWSTHSTPRMTRNNSDSILTSTCNWEDELKIAEIVSKQLKFPLHIVDFSSQYEDLIIKKMVNDYTCGKTPNPDVLCNRDIKFDLLLKKAQSFDHDYFATGHYARIKISKTKSTKKVHLLKGVDPLKDQSYFLSLLTQEKLKNILFPVGHL